MIFENIDELRDFLDEKVKLYNTTVFIDSDPIQLPHRFTQKEDIEIVAFLVATIAWGNRASIIKSGERILKIMGNNPHDFILNYSPRTLDFVHRTFNAVDLNAFFMSLNRLYTCGIGLEGAFREDLEHGDSKGRIHQFRQAFIGQEFPDRTKKHLSDPVSGSSAKRLNMFLRWMVRKDKQGVDFGIWDSISTSELRVPLDVHTGNIARHLGLITRKQNDWKALDELHSYLIQCDPIDPCKYDFALFGLGAFEKLV